MICSRGDVGRPRSTDKTCDAILGQKFDLIIELRQRRHGSDQGIIAAAV